jgi:hypothetical protein
MLGICGVAIVLLSFAPWLDFDFFTVSGTDVPGRTAVNQGYLTAGIGLVMTVAAALWLKFATLRVASLIVLVGAGSCAFAIAADDLTSDWSSGACPGPTVQERLRVCRESSDFVWSQQASPTAVPWVIAGISAFVALLSVVRLLAGLQQPRELIPGDEVDTWA